MIHEHFQIDTIPECCGSFVSRFEAGVPSLFSDLDRSRESAWTGDRLFLGFFWRNGGGELIADFRFQAFPVEKEIFIGSIETHPDHRGRGIATALVKHLEEAVSEQKGEWKIRLFAQQEVAGFWEKLGYVRECDVRYLFKEIT